MDIFNRIKEIISNEQNNAELDKFLAEVRESLASSGRQFIVYSTLIIAALTTYHLVVYEGATGVSIGSIQVPDLSLFRKVFLVFPASLVAAMTCVGYLRRIQREVYDYLTISRYRVLGKTGLHELRLPSDYILGLFILRNEGGVVGKVISYIVALLSIIAFVIAPVIYIVGETIANLKTYGIGDVLSTATSVIAIALCASSFVIIYLSGRIKA